MRWSVLAAAFAISAACVSCAAPQAASPAGAAAATSGSHAAHEAAEARAYVVRAETALREGRSADAENLFLEAIEESPPDTRTLNGLARARTALGKRDAALEDLGRSLALGETAEALALRGRLLGLARRFDDAERDLQRAVELASDDAHAWAVLGAVEINRGDDVEAERAFAAVVKLLGSVDGPDRLWTQLLSMPPDPVHPQESLDRCTRGRVALLQGLWVDAHAEHLNGLRYSPRFLWCVEGLAEATWRLGGTAKAEQALRGVIANYATDLAPLRADAQGKLAGLLVSQRRAPAECASLARSALAVRGERAALLDVLGRACDALSDGTCASEAYQRLLSRPRVPVAMRAHAEQRLTELTTSPAKPRP